MSTEQERREQWEITRDPNLVNLVRERFYDHQNRTHQVDVWHRGHSMGVGVALSTEGGTLFGGLRPTSPVRGESQVVLNLVTRDGADLVSAPDKPWRSYKLECATCGKSETVAAHKLLRGWLGAKNFRPGAKNRPRITL